MKIVRIAESSRSVEPGSQPAANEKGEMGRVVDGCMSSVSMEGGLLLYMLICDQTYVSSLCYLLLEVLMRGLCNKNRSTVAQPRVIAEQLIYCANKATGHWCCMLRPAASCTR